MDDNLDDLRYYVMGQARTMEFVILTKANFDLLYPDGVSPKNVFREDEINTQSKEPSSVQKVHKTTGDNQDR